MTADGGPAGGGKQEAAGGRFGAREAAIRSNPPPSVRASSPDARRPPPGGRRKRRHAASVPSTSGAAQRRTLPSPASSRARSLGAEGLAGRLASSATGMTSPERLGRAEMLAQGVPRVREQASHCASIAARGNHRRTRDDGSGGPVTGRSGGTTDHAAERNAGSGQARSVTPLAARSVPDADGVERSGTEAYTESRASGERRTAEEHDDDHAARDTRASRDSGERGAYTSHARARPRPPTPRGTRSRAHRHREGVAQHGRFWQSPRRSGF
jgi:hypothetical protein